MNPSEISIPVILGHAACTGGSLIYRGLLSTFNFVGLNEVGVAPIINPNMYNPWDPHYQLLAQNLLTPLEFGETLFDRVNDCHLRVLNQKRTLLIREHTHSHYFNPITPELIPNGGSWWSDLYEQKLNQKPKGLVSVRNPIDSWLGLRRSFPTQLPQDFDLYCQLYNKYLDKIDDQNSRSQQFHVFRYEDYVQSPQIVMDKIAQHLNVPCREFDSSTIGQKIGSGSSGRRSKELKLRSRRPFSMKFFRQTVQSTAYKKLCLRLDYPELRNVATAGDKIRASGFSLFRIATIPIKLFEKPAKNIREKAKGISNIQ